MGATLSVGIAFAGGMWAGYWRIWVAYAVFNAVGLILYLDGLDVRRARIRRRARVVQILAVLLLPVGIIGVLLSDDPGSPGTHAIGDVRPQRRRRRDRSRAADRYRWLTLMGRSAAGEPTTRR